MILSDHDIEESLRTGWIGVDPHPTPEQIQPASLDVRIGNRLYRPSDDTLLEPDDELEIEPGQRYLGTTVERIEMPNSLAGQLAGRSSVGRRGVIVHKTAGWIDPGFEGELTLELFNLGEESVSFDVGARIAQLVFFRLETPSSGYDGEYQGQSGPTEAYR